jgi:hypothetical protein
VASASGTSNFCTVASDSPNSVRSFVAASPSASSTFSLEAAVICFSARGSPLWQFTAFNPSTYWLPRLAIDPAMYALLPARWQSSRVTSGVSFVLAGRDINFKVAATLFSGSTFRNGDWLRATLSAVFSVSSKTASPVLLAKSNENDGVLIRQAVCGVAGAEVERSRDCSSDEYHGGGNQDLPVFSARDRNFSDHPT